ncbi:MAG: ABC transporter permease [Streptosporangiaceae bacterium]|jgi:peptide/nickel transport system permease protein
MSTIADPVEDAVSHADTSPGVRQLAASWLVTRLRQPGLTAAWLVVIVVVLWAIVPGVFTTASPVVGNIADALQPPSIHHIFGTDDLGRDMYTRMVYGASHTLSATLYAVAVGFFAGGTIGLVSGYAGGIVDGVVMRFIDVLLSVPTLMLCMVIVAALGYDTMNVALSIGIVSIASFARVMRADVLRVTHSEYVESSYGLGAKRLRVLVLHVLPNSVGAVLSLAALECGVAMLAVAGLGFLGYGDPPPTPEWGLAVAEGQTYLATQPYLALIPGAVIAVVVLSTNRISRSIGKGR